VRAVQAVRGLRLHRERAATVLAGLAALTGVAALAGAGADYAWVFELASHFRAQYAVVLALCALGLALLGRHWVAAGCLALAGANVAYLLPYLRGAPAATTLGQPLAVLSLNVYRHSREHARVVDYVRSSSPDVAVFLEATPEWRAGLAPLADVLPYEAYAPGAGSNGILIRSRHRLQRASPVALGGQPQGALSVWLSPYGHPLELLGAHLSWPMTPAAAATRNRELAGLAKYARRAPLPLVVVGDFNATRYTAPFARMLRDGGYADCAAGGGLHGTWPTRFVPGWIKIDHCLHTKGIWVDRYAVGPYVGSDHYPLAVVLRVPDSAGLAGAAPVPPSNGPGPAVVAMPPVSASRIAASTGMSSGWTDAFGTKIVYPPIM
jgi:endonuclease/exonuclease/phosphatase (EEP) superfamily protein YafD